uniref:V-type proton ATPase subunit C n=1 Tax=Anopheles farauti TaxID=69004 RepID=A0A182Q1D1_9DIPT
MSFAGEVNPPEVSTMSEYWLISAPGDKTCQQTWETMNNVTSKQNNLCENFKFHIPDLKVGTLDQLVGLSDDLGKLDAYVEQTTRKIAAYLGDVLEDQRDKLYENLQANNNDESGSVIPAHDADQETSSKHPDGGSHRRYQRNLSTATTSSSRHGSTTTSSSSACSVERYRDGHLGGDSALMVCTCPLPSSPTTPTTPPTVVCQVYDFDISHSATCSAEHDESCGSKAKKDPRRQHSLKPPPLSPRSPSQDTGGKSRKGSDSGGSGSSYGQRLTASSGRPPDDDDDDGGHSAPETDREQDGGSSAFEWRWFHRRKHSQANKCSRSSSHLFGGHSPSRMSGLRLPSPVSSSCCGGKVSGSSRHGRHHDGTSSPSDQDADAEVYGGMPVESPPLPSSETAPSNGLRLGKTSAGKKSPLPPVVPTLSAVINPDDLTSYITRFQWDLAKYPTKQSLRNIADIMSKQVGQIDADLKTKSAAYNNLKGNLQNLEKKQTGSLLTRNLADLVKKEHFILDSEYLTTLLVIVPKANMGDWNAHYEKITDMIVPRSSQTITQDADYALCTVTLFKKVVDEFKLHARERKFVVREFVYNEEELAAGKNEITKLVTDKKKQFGPLVRWLKVNFSECFCAWMHVKALRVFVESVLRYGLPVNFQAILIHPNKKSTKRLRDVLQQLYGHLDGSAGSSGGNADNVDIPGLGFGQSEYFPYVYYKLNIDMVETKV